MTGPGDAERRLAPGSAATRRQFLGTVAAAVGAGVVATACGGSSAAPTSTSTTTPTSSPLPAEGDARIVTFVARLEVTAVITYAILMEAATAGRFGTDVPKAFAEFMKLAKAHHRSHLDVWNSALAAAGGKGQDEQELTFKRLLGRDMRRLRDVAAAIRVAMVLEERMAATYLSTIPGLSDPAARTNAGAMYGVDRQHITVLSYISGAPLLADVVASPARAMPLP